MKIPDETKQFLETVPVIAFSTADKNGIPNVIAIGSKKVASDDTIWVIDTFFKKTKANLLQNNKVAIAMWKEGKGYQIKGLATYHSEGRIFDEGKDWILGLKPNKRVKGVIEIEVTEIYSLPPGYEEAGKRKA